MNLHTADPMQPHDDSSSATAAAGDKRKRETDDAADPVVKKERSSGGGPADAAMVQAPTNGFAALSLHLTRMRAPEAERPRAFSVLHLADGAGVSSNDPAHLVCFYSIDHKNRAYVRLTAEQWAELRTMAVTQGVCCYERVDMRADCGIDMAAPLNKVEADIERGPMLVRRMDEQAGAAAATASAAASASSSSAASNSSASPSSLFLYVRGVLLPISLVQGLIWYRNPTGPQNWDPELRFVQDCERTPAQIEAHAPEQNFATRLDQAIPGTSTYAHHMRSSVLDLRFAGNADGSASSVSSGSSATASFTKQQRDAVSSYLAAHLPPSFSILKLNVTIAQLKSMEREADEEAPRVPTQVAPSYGVCEHHRSKQPVPYIQVKADDGLTPMVPSSHSSSSSSEMAASTGYVRTPPLGQSAGPVPVATGMSPMNGASVRVPPMGPLPMHPNIMHPMVPHPAMQMMGPMGPQQQQAQAYAMMQQQQQQQQQQGHPGINPAMHLGMNPPQMHPSHMPPGGPMHPMQAQLMAQAQLNLHHQQSLHSAQSAAAAHLHHQQQQQQAAAFAAANQQMMSGHPGAGMPPHMLPHPMQMQMHMPFPVRHMMQQQQQQQMQHQQQSQVQHQQHVSPTHTPSLPMQHHLQPLTALSRPVPSPSPPAKSVASAKSVIVPDAASPESPVLVSQPAAAAAASLSTTSHPVSPPSSVSALAPPLPALRNGLTLTERTVYAGRLMACQGCHAVKSSCDAERPCFRCVRMGRQCIQREKARQRKTSKPSRPRPSNTAESRQIFAEHRAAAALLMANSTGPDGSVVSDDSADHSDGDN